MTAAVLTRPFDLRPAGSGRVPGDPPGQADEVRRAAARELGPRPAGAEAPERRSEQGAVAGPSLDDHLRALLRGDHGECLVCGERVHLRGGAAQCLSCGSVLATAARDPNGQMALA